MRKRKKIEQWEVFLLLLVLRREECLFRVWGPFAPRTGASKALSLSTSWMTGSVGSGCSPGRGGRDWPRNDISASPSRYKETSWIEVLSGATPFPFAAVGVEVSCCLGRDRETVLVSMMSHWWPFHFGHFFSYFFSFDKMGVWNFFFKRRQVGSMRKKKFDWIWIRLSPSRLRVSWDHWRLFWEIRRFFICEKL